MTDLQALAAVILGAIAIIAAVVALGHVLDSRHRLSRRQVDDDGYLRITQHWDVPEDWAA